MADYAERAKKIQQRLRARAADINARRDLSDVGRKRQLALATRQASQEMKAIREEAETAKRRRQGEIERSLFSSRPGDFNGELSFRDARDRAGALKTAEEAMRTLALARIAGDDALARAVALRALNEARSNPMRGDEWRDVLNDWGAENTTRDGLLSELAEIHYDRPGPFQYSVPRPEGLTQYDNVDRLAQEADPAEAVAPDPAAWLDAPKAGMV